MKYARALAFALALALVIPGAAFAATSNTTTNVTLAVDATLSVAGIPASIDFGHTPPGASVQSTTFTITVTSSETVWSLTATPSNLTSGGNTITASSHYHFWTGGVDKEFSGTPVNLGTTSPITEYVALDVPSAAKSGSYVGTILWAASN